jgi:hypothetical protein
MSNLKLTITKFKKQKALITQTSFYYHEELYDEYEGVQDCKQSRDSPLDQHLECYKPEDFAMDNEKVPVTSY